MTLQEIEREVAAFCEKVQLAKLEVAKAKERVKELEYQKARFLLDIKVQNCYEANKPCV